MKYFFGISNSFTVGTLLIGFYSFNTVLKILYIKFAGAIYLGTSLLYIKSRYFNTLGVREEDREI